MTFITSELKLDNYRHKRILITGSNGYLANNLLHMLKDVECHITRIASSGKILTLVNGACKVEDVIGDLTQETLWQQVLPHTDIIFHFAGQSNIVQANQEPVADIQRSITPLLLLLETCRKHALQPHIILASNVSLYGNPHKLPVDETFPNQPQSIYDLHKLHCEEYLHYFIGKGYVRGCSLRLTNVYGPGIQASGKINAGLINHAIRRGIEHEPILIHGEGESQRDYLYLDDVSRAFLAAGLVPEKVNNQRFIISNNHSYTVNQVVEKIVASLANLHGLHAEVKSGDGNETASEQRHFCGNSAKFYQATGWQPTVSLDEGIERTIKAQ